jgi:hypothetical protein
MKTLFYYLEETQPYLDESTHTNPHATNAGDQSGEATADRPLGISTPTVVLYPIQVNLLNINALYICPLVSHAISEAPKRVALGATRFYSTLSAVTFTYTLPTICRS